MNRSTAAPAVERSEIDLTPMLDVVFIMLIFFVVTATFVREIGIAVDRPDGDVQAAVAEYAVLIAIAADDTIWIDGRNLDPRAVRPVLEQRRAEHPEAPVVVQIDAQSHTETLVKVLDAGRAAGIYDMAIADPG